MLVDRQRTVDAYRLGEIIRGAPLRIKTPRGTIARKAGPPLTDCVVLGEVDAPTEAQKQAILTLVNGFAGWVGAVSQIASTSDEYGGTLRNMIESAGRQLNKFIDGDASMGPVLQSTMANTMDLAKSINPPNTYGLQDFYDTTAQALQSLIVSVAKTGGEAAGAAIKAAADEVGVKPEDLGSGLRTIVIGGAVIAGSIALIQITGLLKTAKRKNPRKRGRR